MHYKGRLDYLVVVGLDRFSESYVQRILCNYLAMASQEEVHVKMAYKLSLGWSLLSRNQADNEECESLFISRSLASIDAGKTAGVRR